MISNTFRAKPSLDSVDCNPTEAARYLPTDAGGNGPSVDEPLSLGMRNLDALRAAIGMLKRLK